MLTVRIACVVSVSLNDKQFSEDKEQGVEAHGCPHRLRTAFRHSNLEIECNKKFETTGRNAFEG